MAATSRLYLIVLIWTLSFTSSDAQCNVPNHFWGDWFAYDSGIEYNIIINQKELNHERFNGKCKDLEMKNGTEDALGRGNGDLLFYDANSNCYFCYQLFFKTPNILQYKHATSCGDTKTTLDQVCSDISPTSDTATMFKKTMDIVNCKTTFEGVYHFVYEVNFGGGGKCDSEQSLVIACQEPGSPYVDNQVFDMNFGKCPEVTSSSNDKIRFQCMGSWRDETGNVWSAVANLGKDIWRERFRCLLTRNDQQEENNLVRFTMSRWATCGTLKSPYEGDIRLILQPSLLTDPKYFVYGNQLVQPTCMLPRNFTGTWFTTGEYDSDVRINATHIYFKTKLDQFTYKETYFTCVQNRDSRYLMTAVTVGKCEVDYVCFDFLPRHHNIVRWRMSKPYRLTLQEEAVPDFLNRKFRQTCMWSSFTIDRTNVRWKYSTFLLNPPAPIDCPLAGRYRFVQYGPKEEQYVTRIRGITERPRHMIDCRQYESVFESCSANTKKILVDAEYCATVDHTARPIGEYDIPDRELNCVGFWMEDMRSYLITYDEEDPVSMFRCWVYERLDWRNFVVSRATRALCGEKQTAYSQTAEEGASLHMELYENERLFDDCPQRYESGVNPYKKPTIYIMEGAATTSQLSVLLFLASLALYLAL